MGHEQERRENRSGTGWRRARRPLYRRPGLVIGCVSVLIGAGSMAGPGENARADEPCSLPRHSVHHSLGLDTWNEHYPRPDRDLRAAMFFLSFPDAEPSVTPEALAGHYFPATADFFGRASYGQFRLHAEVAPDWVPMPRESAAYGIRRDWAPEQRSAYLRDALRVLEPLVDFAAYDVIYLVADPGAPGVDADATKVVNFDRPVSVGGAEIRRLVTVFEQTPPDRNVLAHETGHVFDLPDLYRRPDASNGDWDTHVGDWDVMGSQFGLAPDPFGWHKWKLGWLTAEHVDCVSAPGVTLHTLQPLGAPLDPVDPEGDTRMVVVRTGPSEALVAEARTATGNDADACSEGVLLYRVRSDVPSAQGPVEVLDGHPGTGACHGRSVHPRLADAPLAAGESYWDAERGVRFEVGEPTSTGGWHLKIVRH
ncbi:M6 family metalloprotease domain-containing protein [Streptomyces sp. YIM 98790]|uniref:M6 family metalloprotease domain-containing protein n=1 Tax=Streptomyces sp. YIM 98790 TaxID=2689077 RepID=UPI00140AEDAE